MATKRSKRGMHVGVRISNDTWEALKRYTDDYERSVSGLVNELIVKFLKSKEILTGPLNKFNKDWVE